MKPASIKVNIADRPYRLTALPHEAERVREAAQLIQSKLRQMRNEYGVLDKQDALAMIALLLSTELLEWQESSSNPTADSSGDNPNNKPTKSDELDPQLQQLDDILTEFLQKIWWCFRKESIDPIHSCVFLLG